MSNLFIDLSLSRTFSQRNQFGISSTYRINATDRNVSIAIELKHMLSSISCIEKATIRQITPLTSIVKLVHGNIGSKGNTPCMWNQSKLCTILPNLPSICQYFVLSYEAKNKSKISLKSTKFERIKMQRCLKLLLFTVEGVWKEKNDSKIDLSHDNLEKWLEHGDIRDLDEVDEVVTISILEEIVQSDKRDLEYIEKKQIQVSKTKTMITVLLLEIKHITYILMVTMLVHHLYKIKIF